MLKTLSEMPKQQQTRQYTRRAASKEALKQMHILLGSEKALGVSSGDDDVIEVDVQPPKKKYKLSHRKSSDGNDRDVIVLKSVTNQALDSCFDLEVDIEELTPSQLNRKKQHEKEEKEIEKKIEQIVKLANAEVIYQGVHTTALQITENLEDVLKPPTTPKASQSIVLPTQAGSSTIPQSYQLVMDPRLGVIVGAVTPTGQMAAPPLQLITTKPASTPTTTPSKAPVEPMKTRRSGGVVRPPSNSTPAKTPQQATQNKTPQTRNMSAAVVPQQNKNTPPAKGTIQVKPSLGKALQPPKNVTKPANVTPTKSQQQARVQTPAPVTGKYASKAIKMQAPTTIPGKFPTKTVKVPAPSNFSSIAVARQPAESTSVGGLAVDKAKSVVDLTSEAANAASSNADNVEVSFNKLQGRTYPSLVVVARPHLRAKDQAADRGKLDSRVKSVLMYHPTKFTEWLIQQGLIKSDQKCNVHSNKSLKLGMYSDSSKFVHSGGYVWISECCPQRFVSVFSGSIFEGSNQPPMAILKLIYHWCCQTLVQNVTQWVKVDNLFVKGMYTWLRGVCTVALHTHGQKLGGPGVRVQVGVISLGTTSQDGNQRQVKVEVLGILETATKYIRLCAIEPVVDGEKNYKRRFSKILEPLTKWVHPSSVIVTDLTVDKSTLHSMGYNHIQQCTATEYSPNTNKIIMDYLRKVVPRMFQNTLSLLSRQIIQQFLDELVWREWIGTTVMKAFDSIILHLSEQTRASNMPLTTRLNKVASNPFKDWSLSPNIETEKSTPSSNSTTSANSSNQETSLSTSKRYGRLRKIAAASAVPAVQKTESPAVVNKVTTPSSNTSTTNKPEPIVRTTKVEPVVRNTKTEPAPSKTKSVVNLEVQRPAKSTSPDVPEQMVPLENYYYGTINMANDERPKIILSMKCTFCKDNFSNNITLMSHLFTHAHKVPAQSEVCRYCLTIVPTADDLVKHISTSHPDETKFNNGFVCLICESHFTNPFMLGKHMSREHCPSELPYMCGTCGYRSSNHKQTIDHFYRVHANASTIQCPFCLKSLTIFSGGRNIFQNVTYFVQHLQKHQKKQLAKRCGRCNLWFVQKDALKEHQTKMHVSQRGKITPYIAPRNGVMVPKSKLDKCPDDAKIINFSTLQLNITNKSLLCKECNKPLTANKHFGSFESCQNNNCQYSTCCSHSMQGHAAKCQPNPKLPNEQLPYAMYCICGYSDSNGNSMAKHLAICERKSAYPSSDAAKAATATHSMLDVLGLVRTSKEPKKFDEIQPIEPLADGTIKHPRGRPRKQKLLETPLMLEEVPERIERVILDIPSDDEEEEATPTSSSTNEDQDSKTLDEKKEEPCKKETIKDEVENKIVDDDDDDDDVEFVAEIKNDDIKEEEKGTKKRKTEVSTKVDEEKEVKKENITAKSKQVEEKTIDLDISEEKEVVAIEVEKSKDKSIDSVEAEVQEVSLGKMEANDGVEKCIDITEDADHNNDKTEEIKEIDEIEEIKDDEDVVKEVKDNEDVVKEIKDNENVVEEIKDKEDTVEETKGNEDVVKEAKDNVESDDTKEKSNDEIVELDSSIDESEEKNESSPVIVTDIDDDKPTTAVETETDTVKPVASDNDTSPMDVDDSSIFDDSISDVPPDNLQLVLQEGSETNDRASSTLDNEQLLSDISEIDKFLSETTTDLTERNVVVDNVEKSCNDIVDAISEIVDENNKLLTERSGADANEDASNIDELNKIVLEKCGDVVGDGDGDITNNILNENLAIVTKDVEVNKDDVCPMDTD